MPLAIVHDYLNQLGGAEKTLSVFLRLTPEATVFTSVIHPPVVEACLPEGVRLQPSFLQKLPLAVSHTRLYLPLLPTAFERLNLTGHELVVSISSAFAKGARPSDGVPHLCYCQTPMRFAWNLDGYMRYERVSGVTRSVVRLLMGRFRRWDVETAKSVTEFVAISRTVQERIRRFYGRESRLIYPPVDMHLYRPLPPTQKEGYYLVLSRLLPYKRIDVAIEACNRLRLPLVVAGAGRDEPRLRRLAGSTVRFTGRVSDEEAVDLLSHARALILTAEEDFGLTPVEAMASGTPVIAYRGGGATESVLEGETGIFFDRQDADALMDALSRYNPRDFDVNRCVQRAKQFDSSRFLAEWRHLLEGYGYRVRAEAA